MPLLIYLIPKSITIAFKCYAMFNVVYYIRKLP